VTLGRWVSRQHVKVGDFLEVGELGGEKNGEHLPLSLCGPRGQNTPKHGALRRQGFLGRCLERATMEVNDTRDEARFLSRGNAHRGDGGDEVHDVVGVCWEERGVKEVGRGGFVNETAYMKKNDRDILYKKKRKHSCAYEGERKEAEGGNYLGMAPRRVQREVLREMTRDMGAGLRVVSMGISDGL